jgi:Bacterial aa3 type cytochrome c oxidase subunit IV
MAKHETAHTRGQMDIAEQTATYEAFNVMSKWGSLYIGALVLFLAVWFAAGAGFLTAAVTAAVVIALGTMLLRDKPAADAH